MKKQIIFFQIINDPRQIINVACKRVHRYIILAVRTKKEVMENNDGMRNQAIFPKGEVKTGLGKVSRYRSIISTAFVLSFILFFFSFCNFKCNGTKVASLKGVNLVTGSHLKVAGTDLLNRNLLDDQAATMAAQKIPANFWAILAFFSSITGVLLFYKRRKREAWFGMLLGAAGFISLLVLQIILTDKIGGYDNEPANISVGFSFAYWLCLLSFLVAAVMSFLRLTEENENPFGNYEDFPPEKKSVPIRVNIITQQKNESENNNK